MKGRICLCPASIAWIRKHLMKSARSTFSSMLRTGSIKSIATQLRVKRLKRTRKRHRSAKQRAATRRLIAFNKRRRR